MSVNIVLLRLRQACSWQSSVVVDYVAHKALNVYPLSLYKKSLLDRIICQSLGLCSLRD